MVLPAGWWHANHRWLGPRIQVHHRASTWAAWLLAIGLFAFPAQSAPVQLLSARSSVLPLPAGGNGDSVDPNLTPDGRFVVFASTANDLTPGGNNFYSLNVFLRDRASNTTVLVSENLSGAGGGNRDSMLGQASTNGQLVVFQSDASDLVPNDTNNATDIFIRDLAAGTTTLVSASTNGGSANGASTDPVMTLDGRSVAFISSASNLVPGDTNGIPDVFVRALAAGTNDLVSANALASGNTTNPIMATPVITPDGRYVAFFSTATNLIPGVPASSQGEVYVRDLLTGTTIWASTNAAALASATLGLSGVPAYRPRLSDDGRYVVFKVGQTGPDGVAMILRYDTLTGTTTVVNTNAVGGYIGYDDSGGPVMTPDGRYVAYVQHEGATNSGCSSVYVWDAQTGTDTLVSGDGNGVPTNTTSEMPLISSNGQFVAFLSDATNLVANPVTTPSNTFHIYRRNLQTGTTELVDVDTNGAASVDETMTSLSLSSDGQLVAFSSPDGGLVAGDNNRVNGVFNHIDDVFVRDELAGTTEMISERSVALEAPDGFSFLSPESVSGDGQWVAFSSPADDLVPNDTNRLQDVFVHNVMNGSNLRVSTAYNGGPALGGSSGSAVIGTNGVTVAFVSSATNLVAGVASAFNNVYLEIVNGPTLLVSVATNGLSGNGDSSDPVISPDGRYVAFLSQASNLAPAMPPGTNTYWRDVSLGQTAGLPGVGAFRPSLGDDGRYVAYSATNGLRIRNMQSAADIYSHAGTILTALIDPTGTKIFYETTNTTSGAYELCVDDVGGGTNLFSMPTQAPLANGASWSDNGRWLAFLSTANLESGDDGINKVYLLDFQTGTLSLLGLAGPATNEPELLSDAPVISGDGRFVAYRSTVVNTAIGDSTAPPNVFLFDRLTGSTTLLTTGAALPGPVAWMSRPIISAGGATVAFLNDGSSLTAGVWNRTLDAFGASVDVNAALIDSDNDGIPDWWMIKYFGHPTGETNDLSLASDDADGTGMSNLQKYIAGLNPLDPSSVFKLSAVAAGGGVLDLTWPAELGRTYEVQFKTNLTDAAWVTVPESAWVIGNQGYDAVPATQTNGFYRVLVSL